MEGMLIGHHSHHLPLPVFNTVYTDLESGVMHLFQASHLKWLSMKLQISHYVDSWNGTVHSLAIFFFKYISFVMKKVSPVSSLHIDCKFIGHTISPHKTSVTILFLTSNPSHPPTKEEKIEGRPLNAKVLTERKSFPLFPDSFTTLAYNGCLCELQFQTPNFPLGFLSLPAAFAFKPGWSHHHFALWKSVPK